MAITLEDIDRRLTRIETRMTRALEVTGIDTSQNEDWLKVVGNMIILDNIGRSLKVIINTARERGAEIGEKEYYITFKGKTLCTI